jgi:Tol biopolymer transport system component
VLFQTIGSTLREKNTMKFVYTVLPTVCRNIFVLIAVAMFMFPGSLMAQFGLYNHPELSWETIETEHFKIHYHSGEYRTPRLIAKILEEIYDPVTDAYNFEPDAKLDVVVRDHDDYSNGAAYYYDNKIEIWASSLDFLLRGTSNWLRNVVTHEFTHMIQIQTARKLPRRIPALYLQYFGFEEERRPDVLIGFPNRIVSYPIAGTVMPSWFAEGAAQYQTLKQGFETWDSHRDMILRTRALNNGVYSLAEMGVFGKSSIGNESVYNQGFSFITYLAETYGDDVLKKISKKMSSITSFTIERAIGNVTGEDAHDVFNAWKINLEQQYLSRSDRIDKNLKQGTIVREAGTGNVYPEWSPDGTSFVYLSNGQSDFLNATNLYVNYTADDETKFLTGGVGSPPVWDRSGERIVYSKLTQNENSSFFYDLYVYTVESGDEEKLTSSARVHYPSIAPDGKTVYYVSASDRFTTLNVIDIETKESKVMKAFEGGEDIFVSSVSPDGNRIVFAVSSGFGRDIAIINSDGTGFRYILKEKYDERNPTFSPDGQKIYYSSDKNGIYNIYDYNLASKESNPLTNVLGGAFMPSISDKGELIFSLYTDDGYKIAVLENMSPVEPAVMVYQPDYGKTVPDIAYDDTDIPDLKAEPYELRYSTTFFMPRVVFDYNGTKLGFYSNASDVLGKYTLLAGAAMNAEKDRDLFALIDFRFLKQTFSLELYNTTRNRTLFSEPDEVPDRQDDIEIGYWEAAIGARQTLSRTQTVMLRASVSRQNFTDDPTIDGVNFRALKLDFYKGLDIGFLWRYRKVLPRLDMVINPTEGRQITLNYWFKSDEIFQDFIIEAGSFDELFKQYNYHRIDLDWSEYKNTPFIMDRSAITVNFQGGYISRPVDDFLYYFAGGIRGLKGYSYYSIEGNKKAILSTTYRFPLLRNIARQIGPWYFDKLYASVGYQVGDAWDTNGGPDIDNLKNVIDLGLRLDTFSFYAYPTKIGFNAAYGLDRTTFGSVETNNFSEQGREWKFFLTVLFGYDF